MVGIFEKFRKISLFPPLGIINRVVFNSVKSVFVTMLLL